MTFLEPFLRSLANRSLQGAVRGRLATTQRERDAIARLRYTVHVEEQNVALPEADHERRRVWYLEDEHPGTLHFYAGTPDDMQGSLRVRVWGPGAVPDEQRAFYSMDKLADIERRTVCDVSKMMMRRGLRGGAALAALTGHAVYETVKAHGNHAMFACAAPGLLRRYQGIGLRTFGGRLRHTPWGLIVPLVGITHDPEHLYRLGSPWYPPVRRLQREGLLPDDLPAVRAQAEDDRSALLDAHSIRRELAAFAAAGKSPFLKALPREALEALSSFAMILDVPPEVYLCREGVLEREVYLVLEGEFAALRGETELRRMGQGELFGEIALLSEAGHRTADVRSVGAGRVLVLRRRFLAELASSKPRLAVAIYEALMQALLGKLFS